MFFQLFFVSLLCALATGIPWQLLKKPQKINGPTQMPPGALFNTFEASLLNDTNLVYQIQNVFFPPENHLTIAKIPFSVTIILENIVQDSSVNFKSPFNCSVFSNECVWRNVLVDWYPELTAASYNDDLRQYVLSIHHKLRDLEYVSYSLLQLLAEFSLNADHELVSFSLRVSSLRQLPGEEESRQALLSIMNWLKAYARCGFSDTIHRADSDKGDVFFTAKEKNSYLEICIIILFVSLNLVLTMMAGVFLRSFSAFLVRKATAVLKESTRMLSLYWATALVLTAVNLACFGADLYAFQYTIPSGKDHNILYAKMFLMGFLVLIEPFIVYYTTRHFGEILNVPDKVVQALCCCFSNVYGSRFAHTIAVVHVLWFIHRAFTATILVLFHVVVAPAETFTALTLILSILIIIVFLTSYVLHTCSSRRRVSIRTICKISCALLACALASTAVVSFALVYLSLVDNGLQTTGVSGFLLSLFPPFLFFSIGLIIQRKCIKKNPTVEKEEEKFVSGSTGNVTKLAEYQQSEMEHSILAKLKFGRKKALSVQFMEKESTIDHNEDKASEEEKLTYVPIE